MADGVTVKRYCNNRECTLHNVLMTDAQWTALMGGGEPVDFDILAAATSTQPEPVDDAVLRDAARYRWLRARERTDDMDIHGIYIGVDSAFYKGRWALFETEADKEIDAAMNVKEINLT